MDERRTTGLSAFAGRRTLAAFGVLVALCATMLAGCGGGEEGEKSIPPTPEEAGSVIVRVSGTEGIAYTGDYGSLGVEELQTVDAAIEGDPTNYEVQIGGGQEGLPSGVNAFFQKTEPGTGQLMAEILADGEVVTSSTTYAEFGSVSVDWLPRDGLSDALPPGELFEGDLPEEDIEGPPPDGDIEEPPDGKDGKSS